MICLFLVQKDACGHTGPGPACCTNEVVGSYALSLGHDMKRLFDGELNEVKQLLVTSKKHVERKCRRPSLPVKDVVIF